MKTAGTSATQIPLPRHLQLIKEWLYDRCGLAIAALDIHPESKAYEACSFLLNGIRIEYRVSKITPKKTGQFVAIWKRNKQGETRPLDIADDFDFLVIAAKDGDKLGQFVFPKPVLALQGIITNNGREGKRGIRVYPPWDSTANAQAMTTQDWQTKYFLVINDTNGTDIELAKRLFAKAG